MAMNKVKINSDVELKDRLVAINRVTKVTKGGRTFTFAAIVVVGDGNGIIGWGLGKAGEVTAAISKGVEAAKKNIKEKTAKLARKKNITLVLQNLDNALELIKANPDIPKSVIINQALNGALSVISESTNNDLHKFQENLQQLSMICELVEKLNIPDYSPDTKYRDEILKKYDEIINYNEKLLANAAKSSEIITLTDEI